MESQSVLLSVKQNLFVKVGWKPRLLLSVEDTMFLMVHVFLTVQQESTVCPTCVSDGVGV